MVKALQNLGDRLVGRLVPEVVAEAGVQDYQRVCGCLWDSPGFMYKVQNCVGGPSGGCGACYAIRSCKP